MTTTHVYKYISSTDEFVELTNKHSTYVVVFSASWCKPCQLLKEWLDTDYKNFEYPIVVVDIDNQDIEELHEHVTSVPIIEIVSGNEKFSKVGFAKDEIKQELDRLQGNDDDVPELTES